MNADLEPTAAFRKLSYLISHPPYPPETFGNLLLLHCKYQNYDIAAGLLAENSNLTFKYLTQELYDFLEASVMVPISAEEAYRKFDDLANKHVDKLRKMTKLIQDSRLSRDNESIKNNLKLYDEELERYIPVLMAQARIYWDRENYAMVEKLFFQSAEFCSEHEVWKLNVAHVYFMQVWVCLLLIRIMIGTLFIVVLTQYYYKCHPMRQFVVFCYFIFIIIFTLSITCQQESKFKDAIKHYEPIVKRLQDSLLDITAVVLANLCVSHIMSSQNDEAEDLMRR
jgi:tetratricopeptide repeat protein 30